MLILKFCSIENSSAARRSPAETMTVANTSDTEMLVASSSGELEHDAPVMTECSEIEFVVPPPPPPPPRRSHRIEIPGLPDTPCSTTPTIPNAVSRLVEIDDELTAVRFVFGVDYLGCSYVACSSGTASGDPLSVRSGSRARVDDEESKAVGAHGGNYADAPHVARPVSELVSRKAPRPRVRRRKFASDFAEQLRASIGDSDDSDDEIANMARANQEELFSSVQHLRQVSEQLERELNARSSFAAKLLLADLEQQRGAGEADPTSSGAQVINNNQRNLGVACSAENNAARGDDDDDRAFELQEFDEARFEFLMRAAQARRMEEEDGEDSDGHDHGVEEDRAMMMEDQVSRSAAFGCYLEPILEENSDDLRSDVDVDDVSSCSNSTGDKDSSGSLEDEIVESSRSGRENFPSVLPPSLEYASDASNFTSPSSSSSGEEDDDDVEDRRQGTAEQDGCRDGEEGELLRSASPLSSSPSVKSERDIAVPKKRRKLSPSFLDRQSKTVTPNNSGDEEDSGAQTMSIPKDCSSSSSSSSSYSPQSYACYGSSMSSLATPELLSSSNSSSRASKRDDINNSSLKARGSLGGEASRASLTAREMSKFAVLLSPSVVDRIRMFRSCGDLTLDGLDEDDQHDGPAAAADGTEVAGSAAAASAGLHAGTRPYARREGVRQGREDSWFPISELLKPILKESAAAQGLRGAGGTCEGADHQLLGGDGRQPRDRAVLPSTSTSSSSSSSSPVACTAGISGGSNKAVAIAAAAFVAGVSAANPGSRGSGQTAGGARRSTAGSSGEKQRNRLARRSGDILSDDSGYGDCGGGNGRVAKKHHQNDAISRILSQETRFGGSRFAPGDAPSPRTSRRIRLANLLTRDRERQLTTALTLGIPRYSLSADDPWVDKIKRLKNFDNIIEAESSSGDEPLSFEKFQENLEASRMNRQSGSASSTADWPSAVNDSAPNHKPRPKPRSKRPSSMIESLWSSTPDSDLDPANGHRSRPCGDGEEPMSSGDWPDEPTMVCTCAKEEASEGNASALPDGLFAEAHDSLLIARTHYPYRNRHHPGRRQHQPPQDLPIATDDGLLNAGPVLDDGGHSSGEETAASSADARRRQPISPELAREFLLAEGLMDDSLLTNYNPSAGLGMMEQPYHQGDPFSSYFFGSNPLRTSVSAPSLTAPDLGIPVPDGDYYQNEQYPDERGSRFPACSGRDLNYIRPVSQMMTAADFSAGEHHWDRWYARGEEFGEPPKPMSSNLNAPPTTIAGGPLRQMDHEPEFLQYPQNYIWAEPEEEDHLFVFPGGAWEGHSYLEANYVLDESADMLNAYSADVNGMGTSGVAAREVVPVQENGRDPWIDFEVGIPVSNDVWGRRVPTNSASPTSDWLEFGDIRSTPSVQVPSMPQRQVVFHEPNRNQNQPPYPEDPTESLVPESSGTLRTHSSNSEVLRRDFADQQFQPAAFATSTPIHDVNNGLGGHDIPAKGRSGRGSTSPARSVRFSPTISEIFMIEPSETPTRQLVASSSKRSHGKAGSTQEEDGFEFKKPASPGPLKGCQRLPPLPSYTAPPPPPPRNLKPQKPPRCGDQDMLEQTLLAEPRFEATTLEICKISDVPRTAKSPVPKTTPAKSGPQTTAQALLAEAMKVEQSIAKAKEAMSGVAPMDAMGADVEHVFPMENNFKVEERLNSGQTKVRNGEERRCSGVDSGIELSRVSKKVSESKLSAGHTHEVFHEANGIQGNGPVSKPIESDLDDDSPPARRNGRSEKTKIETSQLKFASTLDVSKAVKLREKAAASSLAVSNAKAKTKRPMSMINPEEARISGETLQEAFELFRKQAEQDRQRLAQNVKNLHDVIESSVKSAIKRPQLPKTKIGPVVASDSPSKFQIAASAEVRKSSQEIDKKWDEILSKSNIKKYGKLSSRSKSQGREGGGVSNGNGLMNQQWPSAAQYFTERQRSSSTSDSSQPPMIDDPGVQAVRSTLGSVDCLDSGEILFLCETHLDSRLLSNDAKDDDNLSFKARSMTNLGEDPGIIGERSPKVSSKSSKRSSPTDLSSAGQEEPPRAKSMEFLLDDGNKEMVKPPENTLMKEDRQLSEHELRFKKSLQRLNLPEWFVHGKTKKTTAAGDHKQEGGAVQLNCGKRERVKPGGWEEMKRASTSSLQSSRATTPTRRHSADRSRHEWRYGIPRDPANSDYSTVSSPAASTRSHEPFFQKWWAMSSNGNSASGSRQSRSTSPCSQSSVSGFSFTSQKTCSSSNGTSNGQVGAGGRKPYLGWRSQEKLNKEASEKGEPDGVGAKKKQRPQSGVFSTSQAFTSKAADSAGNESKSTSCTYLSAPERMTQSMLRSDTSQPKPKPKTNCAQTKAPSPQSRSDPKEDRIRETIKDMSNAIVHYWSETKEETFFSSKTEESYKVSELLAPASRNAATSPRESAFEGASSKGATRKQTSEASNATPGSNQSKLWIESSFVGIPLNSHYEEFKSATETFFCSNSEHEHSEENRYGTSFEALDTEFEREFNSSKKFTSNISDHNLLGNTELWL